MAYFCTSRFFFKFFETSRKYVSSSTVNCDSYFIILATSSYLLFEPPVGNFLKPFLICFAVRSMPKNSSNCYFIFKFEISLTNLSPLTCSLKPRFEHSFCFVQSLGCIRHPFIHIHSLVRFLHITISASPKLFLWRRHNFARFSWFFYFARFSHFWPSFIFAIRLLF